MRIRLKPLSEQVVVITGASSGIGLALARLAAAAGARVVLCARNEPVLRQIAEEITAQGGQAHPVCADVGDPEAVALVRRAAVARFGRIDAWVNDAGVGVYGELLETEPVDHERLFRTNYFGVVNGSLEAVRQMREQAGAGVIVNLGSALSDAPAPLMGAYSASKHAVKAFTETLRMEVGRERLPISVTLIKPGSIATPFPEHARNLMDEAPTVPPPVYAPEVAARAILHALTHPVRELVVGSGARQLSIAHGLAPGLAERIFSRALPPLMRRKGAPQGRDALHRAGLDGHVHGQEGSGRGFSVYTLSQTHRGIALGLGLLAISAAAVTFARGPRGAEVLRKSLARPARPLVLGLARRRPIPVARLAASRPRAALKLARMLR